MGWRQLRPRQWLVEAGATALGAAAATMLEAEAVAAEAAVLDTSMSSACKQ